LKGVGEDDASSHDRVQGDLSWFSGFRQLGVFCFQIRIETSGDERWHVERLSQVGADRLE